MSACHLVAAGRFRLPSDQVIPPVNSIELSFVFFFLVLFLVCFYNKHSRIAIHNQKQKYLVPTIDNSTTFCGNFPFKICRKTLHLPLTSPPSLPLTHHKYLTGQKSSLTAFLSFLFLIIILFTGGTPTQSNLYAQSNLNGFLFLLLLVFSYRQDPRDEPFPLRPEDGLVLAVHAVHHQSHQTRLRLQGWLGTVRLQ